MLVDTNLGNNETPINIYIQVLWEYKFLTSLDNLQEISSWIIY